MGSSLSRPTAYPFPTPVYDVDRQRMASKSGRWTLSSITNRNKKGKHRENYDDFLPPKHFTTYPATYTMPYYQQPQFPYYGPVQMAVVQPIGFQQPVLPMPQAYVPMATYQSTAAPVQPPVAPAPVIQYATSVQMPVPASAAPLRAPASAPAIHMPVPASASAPQPPLVPPLSSAPPLAGPVQMPQPQPVSAPAQMPDLNPVRDPFLNEGPVIPIPPSPVNAEPFIPPPPPGIAGSVPPRGAPDSTRSRFTDFYRPPDFPSPRRASIDEPVRPLPAGPAGRTPFAPPVSMPTPSAAVRMPTPAPTAIPTSRNPLPPPPADVWNTEPYRQVLQNLPTDVSTILDLGQQRTDVFVGVPDEPIPRPSSRLGALFGSSSRKDKGKGPLRGLFRSRSTSGQDVLRDVLADLGSASGSRHGHDRVQSMTALVIPPPSSSTMDMPVPTQGPSIRFDHVGQYAGFVNHSNHRVMYNNKMYPTALHLLEAMKFTHQPSLQEKIRTCKDVTDMYPLSASYHKHVRSDWGQVFLQTMEDVLYLKFRQHPNLRTLLLSTGLAGIVYADVNEYWGEGATGEGNNELGKALVRVRERLRQEGDR